MVCSAPTVIEKKWQKRWEVEKTFAAVDWPEGIKEMRRNWIGKSTSRTRPGEALRD